MAYKIVWSPKAIDTFERVIEYLEHNWTEREIIRFVKDTDRLISLISKNPYIFRASVKQNIHEAVITEHNLLLYQVAEKKQIEILAFFDTRQDPKKKF